MGRCKAMVAVLVVATTVAACVDDGGGANSDGTPSPEAAGTIHTLASLAPSAGYPGPGSFAEFLGSDRAKQILTQQGYLP